MIPDYSSRTLNDLTSLVGKRAVVTGGARGIGAAAVARLAEAGADVLVTDIDEAGAAATATAVAQLTGRQVLSTRIDIGDTSTIVAAADLCVEKLGGLDIWVNNAGTVSYTHLTLPTID
jgi:NAD(P)-dependent dehydrogenase (short-subunit alcohol dehydrogenase family)